MSATRCLSAMDDRARHPDMGPPWRPAGSRADPPPATLRRRQATDEMRIQVHDDGVVEFSVMLGANVDANQLAELVAAVRSSTRAQDGPASSPDLASLRRVSQTTLPAPAIPAALVPPSPAAPHPPFERPFPPRRVAKRSATFTAIPLRSRTPPTRTRSASQSPRLPDRELRFPRTNIPPLRSLPAALAAAAPPSDRATSSRRSLSTPELRRGNAPLPAAAVDASGDALMADVRAMSFDLVDPASATSDTAVRGLPAPVATGRKHSPPDKMQHFIDDELSATWQDVEYELTAKYRASDAAADVPKLASANSSANKHSTFHSGADDTPLPSPPPRAPWRLLARMRRRRRAAQSPPPSTAATARADAKTLRAFGSSGGFGILSRDAEGAGGTTGDSLSLAFSTLMSREQAIAEVARFAKLRGNQVWRRPGDFKLRCVRKLHRSAEMHMSIVVEDRDSYNTVVVIRRSRTDRSRTETWRFYHFFRDIMQRLSISGHHVVPLTPVPTSSLSFRPRS